MTELTARTENAAQARRTVLEPDSHPYPAWFPARTSVPVPVPARDATADVA
ncbi:hypothetical protein ACIRVF_24700 [Kitasatospora sp. NPDC101157]|uniref:hypothetical protein n=1 Tax=Kitasatospora sp. NPDC101157 TaxID=3364098 RepID=UPI00381B0F09